MLFIFFGLIMSDSTSFYATSTIYAKYFHVISSSKRSGGGKSAVYFHFVISSAATFKKIIIGSKTRMIFKKE